MTHYAECWKDEGKEAECITLCGKEEFEHGTKNAIHVDCEDCKKAMGIAGTFKAQQMRLEQLQEQYL